MLDIKFVRENPEIVKQNIRNKFQDSKLEFRISLIHLYRLVKMTARTLRLRNLVSLLFRISKFRIIQKSWKLLTESTLIAQDVLLVMVSII